MTVDRRETGQFDTILPTDFLDDFCFSLIFLISAPSLFSVSECFHFFKYRFFMSSTGPPSVEQLVKLPKTVSENRIQERTVEHIAADTPVPQVLDACPKEVKEKVQNYLACIQKVSWVNKEQFEHLKSGVWQTVEARRQGKAELQEQRRQAEQGQDKSKQGKQVRFRRRTENAGEPEVRGTDRQGKCRSLPRADERCRADETNRKGKGKGNGGKGEHEGKGGFGHKGKQQETREREEERVRMAPNMVGRWLTPPGHVGSGRGRDGGR